MSVQGEVGNKFLTDDIIVKEALRLLKNNLIAAPLVYRDLERRFSKVGDVISLEKPYRTKTASGRVLQKQPLVDRKMPFKIDRQEHFGVEVTMRDRTLTIEKFSERYLRSGIIQIANKIDRSVLEALSHAYFSSSMSGSDLKVGDLARANAYMNMVAVPDDGGRRVILHELDSVGISEDIASSFNPGMVRTAIQRGYMGPVSNFDLFKSTNIPTHVVGNYGGTPLMDGDKQTGDVLHTKDWSTSVNGLLNENDVFTIGGVYEINPQSYASTGRLMRFRVVSKTDSDGSGKADIRIEPAINDGSLTTVDNEGNTVSLRAYQNVSEAPADNAAITVIGDAGKDYRQQLAFNREAVALAMVDLELPQAAVAKSRVRDPDSGLSLCMTSAYDINEQTEITRIDAVWGVHMIYPHLAHRIFTVGI